MVDQLVIPEPSKVLPGSLTGFGGNTSKLEQDRLAAMVARGRRKALLDPVRQSAREAEAALLEADRSVRNAARMVAKLERRTLLAAQDLGRQLVALRQHLEPFVGPPRPSRWALMSPDERTARTAWTKAWRHAKQPPRVPMTPEEYRLKRLAAQKTKREAFLAAFVGPPAPKGRRRVTERAEPSKHQPPSVAPIAPHTLTVPAPCPIRAAHLAKRERQAAQSKARAGETPAIRRAPQVRKVDRPEGYLPPARWDAQAVRTIFAGTKLLKKTDPERLRKLAEKAEDRMVKAQIAKSAAGRWTLTRQRMEFVGPPTYRQWIARRRKADKAPQVPEVVDVPRQFAVVEHELHAGPTEEELAARRAAALASVASMVPRMTRACRAP